MKKIYSVRLDQQVAERAKEQAKKENRSFSNYLECLLQVELGAVDRLSKKKR